MPSLPPSALPLPPSSFTCPSAAAPISRGTHLARLASGWAGCETCERRDDHVGASPALAKRLGRRAGAFDPFDEAAGWAGGVAGREVTPRTLARLVAAFADGLDRERGVPAVVLATDGRPAHRTLCAAAETALRRAGCDVLPLGAETDAAVRFAVRTEGAAGGLHLSAAGRPATHAGIVPIAAGGGFLSPDAWKSLREAWERETTTAAPRSLGRVRVTDAAADYERTLWPAFRTLSARRVTVAGAEGPLAARLARLFAALPDDLRLTAAPPEPGVCGSQHAAAGESGGDIFLAVDADGLRTPGAAEPAALVELAADALAAGVGDGTVALTPALANAVRLRLATRGGRVREVEERPAAPWDAVAAGATLAASADGLIVWQTPHGPSVDPVRVVAGLLRTQSKEPRP